MTDTPLDFGLNEVVTEALARVSTQAVVCRFYAQNPIGIGTNHEHKGRGKPFLSKKSRSETDRGKARPNACPTSPFWRPGPRGSDPPPCGPTRGRAAARAARGRVGWTGAHLRGMRHWPPPLPSPASGGGIRKGRRRSDNRS